MLPARLQMELSQGTCVSFIFRALYGCTTARSITQHGGVGVRGDGDGDRGFSGRPQCPQTAG